MKSKEIVPWLGVVLAGGKSSRMGCDKAELKLDQQTLLQRAQTLLLRAGAVDVITLRHDHVTDVYPNCGPLGGIHAAIHHAPQRAMLIIPVDLPLLAVEDIQQLLEAGASNNSISHFNKQFIPLFIPRPDELLEPLTERLEKGGQLSLRSFFESYPAREIVPRHAKVLLNANTPEEWQEILASR